MKEKDITYSNNHYHMVLLFASVVVSFEYSRAL